MLSYAKTRSDQHSFGTSLRIFSRNDTRMNADCVGLSLVYKGANFLIIPPPLIIRNTPRILLCRHCLLPVSLLHFSPPWSCILRSVTSCKYSVTWNRVLIERILLMLKLSNCWFLTLYVVLVNSGVSGSPWIIITWICSRTSQKPCCPHRQRESRRRTKLPWIGDQLHLPPP